MSRLIRVDRFSSLPGSRPLCCKLFKARSNIRSVAHLSSCFGKNNNHFFKCEQIVKEEGGKKILHDSIKIKISLVVLEYIYVYWCVCVCFSLHSCDRNEVLEAGQLLLLVACLMGLDTSAALGLEPALDP
jgi:hypothetical protein